MNYNSVVDRSVVAVTVEVWPSD